jgi:hypothetical protein
VAYINANASYGVTVRYSTLNEYFSAVHAKNVTWSTRDSTDFFPYADFPGNWWTGYFTSRVASKWWIRTREHVLKCAEMLNAVTLPSWTSRSRSESALTKSETENQKRIPMKKQHVRVMSANSTQNLAKLRKLRRALGEATHHDAVSGTSEPWVVEMYNSML